MVAQLKTKLQNTNKMTTKNESSEDNFNATIGNTVLCDGFLIPMTDFVLRINEIEKEVDQFFDSWRMKQLRIIENYAKFLKQPLKLEMFVPCDNDGNILEEYKISPSEREADLYNYPRPVSIEEHNWNKAKEKILFEGVRPYEVKYEDVYIDEEVRDGKLTIEELIKGAGKAKIKLSQTALNTIFG